MSLNIGAILAGVSITKHEDLLGQLGLPSLRRSGRISFPQATSTSFLETAIGRVGSGVVIVNHFLPYDCSFEPGETSSLDERLAQLSQDALVMVFYLDGHTGGSGFALFQDGRRIRRRAILDGSVLQVDEGPPLPPELALAAGVDEESRVFALSALVLGFSLDAVIFSEEQMLTVYEET